MKCYSTFLYAAIIPITVSSGWGAVNTHWYLMQSDWAAVYILFSCFTFRVKDIQSVYLDSTFYDPRFYQIPTRVSFSKWEQDSNCRNFEVLSAKGPKRSGKEN